MSKPLDLYSDLGYPVLQDLFVRHPAAAEFVKEAEFEDYREEIPKTAFAWPGAQAFPVHTPAHAVVSRLYLKVAENVPAPVVNAVKSACDMFELDDALFEEVATKQAAFSDEECLFPEEQSFPIRNAEEVKLASQYLAPQMAKLYPEDRSSVAVKLAAAAELYQVNIAPVFYQYAGATHTKVATLSNELAARAGAATDPAVRQKFLMLKQAVESDPKALRQPSVRASLYHAVMSLDKQAALEEHYDRRIRPAALAVFNTEKTAAADDINLGDIVISATELAQLGPKFFADALGEDVVRDIAPTGEVDPSALADLLATLPADFKTNLANAVRSAGKGHSP